MQKNDRQKHDTLHQLKPQLYSILSTNYSFQGLLDLFKQQLGDYPGTLLQKPVAINYLSIKENVLLAYSIAHPKNKSNERIIEDAFEEAGIDLNDLSSRSLTDLPLETVLKVQLITHFLCQTKIILLDNWVAKLSEDDVKELTLFLKRLCQQQQCTILIYTSNPAVAQRCEEILYLDSLLSVS